MTIENTQELEQQGYTVIRDTITILWLDRLSYTVDRLMGKYQKPQGIVLHTVLYDHIFIDFLGYLITQDTISKLEQLYFGSKCILNSLSVLDNVNNSKTFVSQYHRDLRFWSGDFNIMLNCLVMLDDFTAENGATLVLPLSHKQQHKPSEQEFIDNSIQVTGNRGDILIFNSNLYHCASDNKSGEHRRSIAITLSRPCMKQLLDYPRAIGYNRIGEFNNVLQDILGYNARVPASIEEWEQPEETRYYKKGQD